MAIFPIFMFWNLIKQCFKIKFHWVKDINHKILIILHFYAVIFPGCCKDMNDLF